MPRVGPVDIGRGAERDQHCLRPLPLRQRPHPVMHLHCMPDAIARGGRTVVLAHPALGGIRPVGFERPGGGCERGQQPQVVQRRADQSVLGTIRALPVLQVQRAEYVGAHAVIEQEVGAAAAREGDGTHGERRARDAHAGHLRGGGRARQTLQSRMRQKRQGERPLQ